MRNRALLVAAIGATTLGAVVNAASVEIKDRIPFSPFVLPAPKDSRPLLERLGRPGNVASAPHIATVDPAAPGISATDEFNLLVAMMNQELQERFAARGEDAKRKGDAVQDGAPSGWEFEFEVTMKEQHWRFKKPTVVMRTQTWSFNLPTVRGKEASFDIPDGFETVMVTRCIGGGWSRICTDFPEVRVKMKRVILTVPEVVSERHEVKLDIPEFPMEEVDWIVKVPEFKLVRSAAVYAEEAKKKSDEIADEAKIGMRKDVADIRAKYEPLLREHSLRMAQETRTKMANEFNLGIAAMNGAIESMNAQIQALPEAERPKYVGQLKTWIDNRENLMVQFSSMMNELDLSLNEMVDKILKNLEQAV